jgi:hypothetical protein
MKILLAVDGYEQGKAPFGPITDVSVVDRVEFPEMFWDENLYGSHCRDRENYMRAGACGNQKAVTLRMLPLGSGNRNHTDARHRSGVSGVRDEIRS